MRIFVTGSEGVVELRSLKKEFEVELELYPIDI